jgi:hypothetical protein
MRKNSSRASVRRNGERFTLSPEDQAAVRASYTQYIPPTEELRALTQQLFARALAGDGRILRRENFTGATLP